MINKRIIRVNQTESTNTFLRNYTPSDHEDITIAVATYQTAGRGQGANTWESEAGKNLLFSILVRPKRLPVRCQFLLSEAAALSVHDVLAGYTDDMTVKWPNDIYWKDKKISGTLIETSLSKNGISRFIIGTGVNINQQQFLSDAPNPVSLCQIVGHEMPLNEVLDKIIAGFDKYYNMIIDGDYIDIAALYHLNLYRRKGFHTYRDKNGEFEGAIVEVEDDGHLILRDREGRVRSYAFKQVEFVL